MAGVEKLYLGLYSGWAGDGADAAVVALRGRGARSKARLVQHLHVPFSDGLRRRMAGAMGAARPAPGLPALAELDRDVGVALAEAAAAVLEKFRIARKDLAAAGVSGQPIAYVPPGRAAGGALLAVGSPAAVARRVGAPVVADFVASDLAAGGCGGPVTAWADWLLFRDRRLARVIINLGAVAGLTFLPAGAVPSDVVGFDVGPGTAVLDALAHRFFAKPFDPDGALAAHGAVHAALRSELQAEPYLHRRPPKLTSAPDWGENYVARLMAMGQRRRCGGADLLATATELTARVVAGAVAGLTERPHQVVLSGGGARNIHLAGRIRRLLSPCTTVTVEAFGIPLRAHRAVAMALLAAARLDRVPAHCHSATGASEPVVLGSVTIP